ncbi:MULTISPECIES: hypothetical protein [Streptosporangium]|uniref:Secreted protein n=1 Tax=Streptosporangium brasiliense TaxID=47480 RepID=A0ABT9QVE8_9ACTN|nr:hypothetical protein [Streptosporangium brasiliense]MDP9860966.1 hypothetical protein [Streptosporangium brasiliense]
MSRKVVGTVAALLLVLFAVVHAPFPAPPGLHHEPGLAITLAGGAVLPPAVQHQQDRCLPPPATGPAGPEEGAPAPVLRPPRTAPAVRAVHDTSGPRAPPSSDL